jgi:hypothetical protein
MKQIDEFKETIDIFYTQMLLNSLASIKIMSTKSLAAMKKDLWNDTEVS